MTVQRPTGYARSRPGHPRYSAPSWAAAGKTLIPIGQIPPFRRVWAQVQTKDQGQSSACVPTTWAMVTEISLHRMGFNPPPLSPDFLYSLVNGGSDSGSSPGDVIDILAGTGVCPASFVPRGTLAPAGYSAEAMTAAFNYRLAGTVRPMTFEELVNALWDGWVGGLDVCTDDGRGFGLDSRGVAAFSSGPTDHEIFVGEAYNILDDGTRVVRCRNPWGPEWGVNGSGWITEQHVEAAGEVHVAISALAPLTSTDNPPLSLG